MTTTEMNLSKGKVTEHLERHRIIVSEKIINHIHSSLNEGLMVYVEGCIRTRFHFDAQGIKRYITEIVANHLTIMDTAVKSPR